MTDEDLELRAEAIAADADVAVGEIHDHLKTLVREHNVPAVESERSLRHKYNAYEYAEIEIPVTGDAVGVRTAGGLVVIGRAVTPAKTPKDLFTIAEPRIGTHVDDLTPPAEVCDDPRVRKKGDHMAVVIYSPNPTYGESGCLHRLIGVTALETGPIVDPSELLSNSSQPTEVGP